MGKKPSTPEELDWLISRTCESGACVGVARQGDSVLIRSTSSPEGPISVFTTDEWLHFISGVKTGDFDGIA